MALLMSIGLMSGTSLDGVDAALLKTDGAGVIERLGSAYVPYTPELRDKIRALFNKAPDAEVARELTLVNAAAVEKLLAETGVAAAAVDVIGFHGQTISHNPERRETCQMGDGALLARLTGIDVVNDLRVADVKAGGQGAPLVPVYHQAMAAQLEKPVAILNIGGVANVTYIGETLLAFDVGAGNALIDDWMLARAGKPYDEDGSAARAGTPDRTLVDQMMAHEFFKRPAPKSLDRNAFAALSVAGATLEDGAATLTAFTIEGIVAAQAQFPAPPRAWIVAGGGRLNGFIMDELRRRLGVPVAPIETIGFNGAATEAEAWAYLAVRSLQGLPITFPGTTGAPQPLTGGTLHRKTDTAAA